MQRSLIALGLLAALAAPAAAASGALDQQNRDSQVQQGYDNPAGVDTTTTGSINRDYDARVNAPADANQSGSIQRGDQSTLFGANR